MMFGNMRLNKRLYLTLGVLIFIIFLIGEWSLWQSAQINKKVDNIYTQEVIPLENISRLKGALYRIRDRSLRLIDTKDPSQIKHHKKIIKEQIQRIKENLDIYDNTRLSKEERDELSKFKKNLQEYLAVITKNIYPFLLSKSEKELEKILYKKAIYEFRQAREALNKLSEYQIKRAKIRYNNSNEIFEKQTIIIQIMILILVVMSSFFARSLMRSIIQPITQINDVLKRITHEDFSRKIRISTSDEFGEMSQMLNSSIKTLQHTFEELSTLVNYDKLTGLPNRKMFHEEVDRCIASPQSGEQFAVMFIDVDNFKNINDTYGHAVGDKLLEVIAKRMQVHIRKVDTIARLGGDEFALLIQNIKNPTVAGNIANKILDSLQKPIYIDNHTMFTSISIGIYISNYENESREKVLSYADVAMYEAKNSGKAKYVYFNKEMHEKIQGETLMDNDLRNAIKNDEFQTYFQPIIEPTTELLYGVETLLRWKKGSQIITPDKFITKLESNGMILDVTYSVIEKAFDMIERKNFKGVVSINLSILQFYDKNLIPFLKRALQKYKKVNSQKIYFEITESMFAQNNDLILSTMELMKKLGFKFSLDDFGTGYSSLSYLKDYPISIIKIDKLFIDNILDDLDSQKLLDAIVYLAKKLNLTTIIEGVEDAPTLRHVIKYNSVKIQGYYFYKPMPQSDFEELLA